MKPGLAGASNFLFSPLPFLFTIYLRPGVPSRKQNGLQNALTEVYNIFGKYVWGMWWKGSKCVHTAKAFDTNTTAYSQVDSICSSNSWVKGCESARPDVGSRLATPAVLWLSRWQHRCLPLSTLNFSPQDPDTEQSGADNVLGRSTPFSQHALCVLPVPLWWRVGVEVEVGLEVETEGKFPSSKNCISLISAKLSLVDSNATIEACVWKAIRKSRASF